MEIKIWPWWGWPEGCGRFHNWGNNSHGCFSQQWWFPGAWTTSGPTSWSHQCLGCRGWNLPADVTGGALGEETPTPGCPKHELKTWWSSDCTRSTHKHTGKKTRSPKNFLFIIFLPNALPAILGRENFQTVQKMRQQFPPLKHFCGYSGEERDCRRAGSACISVLLSLLWKQSSHLGNVFWVNDVQCRFLSISTWMPRGVSPAESGMCWKIYLPTA